VNACVLLAAVALAATPARARRGPDRAAPERAVAVHQEILPDGTELLVLPLPGSRRTSIRYVVRSGSAVDPPGKGGLAHVLEHLAADAGPGDGALFQAARDAGGSLNASTSPDVTIYTLDAPTSEFPALAERMLRRVTSPPLAGRDVAREQGIIGTEDAYGGDGGLFELVEDAIFRTPRDRTIGSAASRDAIGRDDLAAFFRAQYVTTNTTIVVAGDLDAAGARAVAERAILLPPALPEEAVAPRSYAPELPVQQRIPAPYNAAVVGYAVAPGDEPVCDALGQLVELRTVFALQVDDPVLGFLVVGCRRVRGNAFVIAAGFTRGLDSGDLPAALDRVFESAARRPMNAKERAALDRRRARTLDAVRAHAPALADAAAALAAEPRAGGRTPIAQLGARMPSPAAVQAAARRAFRPERRIAMEFSPFGQ
jgi:hypothetical protein